MKQIFFAIMSILLMNCSINPKKHELNLTTSKPAKVLIVNSKKQNTEELGQTPVKISLNRLNELSENNEWIHLLVSSPGHVTENIVVNSQARTSIDMDIKLQSIEWWNDPQSQLPSQIANQIGKNIQKVYQLIRQSKLEDAFSSVEKLISQYPQAAFFHDLKGSILVLQGKKKEAISSYERSLQISSDNPETLEILSDLKKRGN